MHTYTVSIRVESAELDTAQVTETLSIEPTQVRSIGQRRSENSVWEKAMWEFEVFPNDDTRFSWDSLEAGLAALVNKLRPHSASLEGFRKDHNVYLWVGILISGFAEVSSISAELLGKLSELGVPLLFDLYPPSRESSPAEC